MEYFKCSCNGSRTTIKILYASLIIAICATSISSNPGLMSGRMPVVKTISQNYSQQVRQSLAIAGKLPDPTLTYDQIYNTTRYAQIPRHIRTDRYNGSTYNNNLNDTKENLFKFKDRYEISSKRDLLVGFAHDPFRYSIPEVDYARGVRVVNPQRVNSDRGKRGVVHLYNMLTCATGCDPVSYKGYGCYCGFLGSGRPTDGIDNCCRLHDECYENIYCPFYTVYFQPYYWKCYHGEPLCALENFQTHPEAVNGCAGRLCECDRRFAMCVKKYSCPRGRALCKSSPLRLIQNILMFK